MKGESMTSAEFAAYLGAAAWAPQIASWVYRYYVKPHILLVPDRTVDIGFTNLGPIFNLRIAISADRKDAIIDSIAINLRHEDGEVRKFSWANVSETFSQIRDSSGNRQTISKDQSAIALKIGTESLIEKFIHFQEPKFYQNTQSYLDELLAYFNFLKAKDPDFVQKTLESKQYHEWVEAHKNSFWWRKGEYSVEIRLGSPKKITFENFKFKFKLNDGDIDALRGNLKELDVEFENMVKSNLPDYQFKSVNWNWRHLPFESI